MSDEELAPGLGTFRQMTFREAWLTKGARRYRRRQLRKFVGAKVINLGERLGKY